MTDREPDPIDEAAAQIDARGDDVAERIEELEERAEALGRDPQQPIATREEGAGPQRGA